MKKAEFIQEVTNILKEREVKTSQENVKQTLEVVEEILDRVVLEGDNVKIFGVKFESAKRAARTWEVNGQSGVTPERIVPKVSYLDSKKDLLTKEL